MNIAFDASQGKSCTIMKYQVHIFLIFCVWHLLILIHITLEFLTCRIDLAGLDYLHSGCHPSIIHRNIKNTTILLDNKMVAKLSNFGLSRETPLEGDPHVSTIVLGTTGYLDPEYDSTFYNFFVQVLIQVCLEPTH